MAEDLSLPTSFKRAPPTESQYDVAQTTETSGPQDKSYSRTLDKDERVGVWILVGLFASSWIAAGYFAPTSEWAHKAEETVVLAFGGNTNSSGGVLVTRKTRRRQLWKVNS
ncbi:hypothetical protein NUW54_g11038 [Trametes sanguinea]|uniref:Uncharacterized protein n=1 Tax=Trametes sanguinea TaxID=158606 RepID=A0ACC1NLR2_9APHY|nr:hypothetical protein NUW54_g11038 [Trametes sanguinea]